MAGMLRIATAARLVLGAAAFVATTGRAAAQAPCSPGSPAPAPCVIAASVNVPSETLWDVGARALVIAAGKTVNVQGFGNITILASDITLETNAKIDADGTEGFGGTVTLEATTAVAMHTGSLIDVSANEYAGFINIAANAGTLDMQGGLDAKATDRKGAGGFITVYGDAGVTINGGGLDASGGNDAEGGLIEVASSGAIVVAGLLDASGGEGDGGEIGLDAGTSVTTQVIGAIDVRSRAGGGFGGAVGITAGGSVTLFGNVVGTATSNDLSSGAGAEIDITSETGDVALASTIDVRGPGDDGDGGFVAVSAGGNVVVSQPIHAFAKTGGTGHGGDLDFVAGGDLSLAALADVHGGALGGGVVAETGGTVEVTASVSASGTTILPMMAAPRGGIVQLQGCEVSVPEGGSIVNLGSADPFRGIIRLQASNAMTIGGTLTAGVGNELQWRETLPTLLPTKSITPTQFTVRNLDLPCCGACTTTTSTVPATTSTTTTTIETTTTTTSTTTTSSVPETTTTSTVAQTTTTTTIETTTTTTTSVDTTTTTTSVETSTTTTTAVTSTTTTTAATTSTTTTLPTACVDEPLVGYDAVDCRLDTIDAVLAGETVDTLGGRRLAKRIANAVTKTRTAMTTARTGRKVVPNLRRANKLLRVFQKSVTSAQKKGLPADVGASLMSLASGATSEIGVLRATRQ